MFIKNNLIKMIIPLIAVSSMTFGALPSANEVNTYGPIHAPNTDQESVGYSTYFNAHIQPYIDSHSETINSKPFYKFTNQNSPVKVNVLTDPNNITITQDSSVRFYFVESTANYNSAFGVTMNNNYSVQAGDTSLVFPNKKSPEGSFVNIPTNLTPAGTILNLYLLADAAIHNGNNPALNVWWSAANQNIDDISHVQVAQFVGTPFYLISFEDLPLTQADIDANNGFIQSDFTIVAEILPIPVPEPATYAILGTFLAVFFFIKRKEPLKQAF